MGAACTGLRRSLAEGWLDGGAGARERGPEGGDEGADDGEDDERSDGAKARSSVAEVELDGEAVREEAKESECETDTEERAADAQHEPFEKKLLNDASAAGSERAANGDLALTNSAASEEETCDVDTGDDPEERGCCEESEDGATDFGLNERGGVILGFG